MRKYRIFINVILVLLLSQSAKAQVDQRVYDLQNVTPPSPNAASLGKYADWPVNLYTGLPEISIPIYELKGRNLSVPIGLSYHASGIKVGENASSVGLGWSLEAGGVITRSVRGLPDDAGGTSGYLGLRSQYNNPGDLSSGTAIPSYDTVDQLSVAQGNSDSEPDLYMFNALGRSYKFYFSGDGTIVTQPYSNLKITCNLSDSSWTVTMEDGTQLQFGGGYQFVEQTSSISFSTYSFISSWCLHYLISPEHDTVRFTYTQSSIQQDGYYYQVDYTLDHLAANNLTSGVPTTTKSGTSKVQNQSVTMLTPATIESDLGRVEFDTTTRSDLTGAVAVSGIKIFSKLQNAYIKSYKYYYGYSTAASGNVYTAGSTNPPYRLKLDSLEEIPSDNSQPNFWQFAYNPKSLPSRKSFAQDYWGYFNGATGNTTFLPPVLSFDPDGHPSGNRSPDSASMMAEMLTRITYPTGGYSQFTYEPNSYISYQQEFGAVGVNPSLYLTADQSNFTNTYSDTFTIASTQYYNFQFEGIFSSTYLADYGVSTTLASAKLFNNTGTLLTSIALKKGDNEINYTTSSIELNPGTYIFTMSSISPQGDFDTTAQSVSLQASFSYVASLGYGNVTQLVGGVRIKSIVSNDNLDTSRNIQKYYQYENPFVVSPLDPSNDFVSLTTDNLYDCVGTDDGGTLTACGAPGCLATSVVYQARNSSTKFSLGSIQGGPIGYGKVTEKFGPNGENGENVYYYSSVDDINDASAKGFPYPAICSLDYERGLLLEKDTYTSDSLLISKTLNTYQFTGRGSIKAYKAAFQFNTLSSCYSYPYFSSLVDEIFYNDYTNQGMHTSSTTITYNTATGDSVESTTYYYYDDSLNMQPVRTKRVNSKGDTVLEYTRTPFELADINSSISLTSTAAAALDTMLSRNMVGQSVETERYVGGALTNKSLKNYKVQPNGLVLPDNVMWQNYNNPIETRINFPGYDNFGNLLQQAKTGDEYHSYIYDYDANYPIAQVVNADTASIAYSSFEADGTGNWTLGSGSVDTTTGFTGSKSFNLGSSVSKAGLNSSTTYLVSYWTTNNSAFSISGTISGYPVKGKTIYVNNNSWTLYLHKVTGQSTITVSGTGHIDELRLYPANAQMITYTYTPLVGMTSQTDIGNRVTYYEYDGLQRLKRIRDQDYNILKTFEYQYQVPGGCGSDCSILAMQTFLGTNTPGFPVGVFDIHGNLVGNATGATNYVNLWNSDTADTRVGTLAVGADSMHFKLSVNSGQTAPSGVTGCRYYQYDLPWNKLDGVTLNNGAYVDFGDGTRMPLPKVDSIGDTLAVMPPNTTKVGFQNQFNGIWYFIHTYPNDSVKTISLYHNEVAFYTGLDNGTDPATSLTKVENLRGNFPQSIQDIGGSCYQQATALTVANVANWGSISSVTAFWAHCGDGVNPSLNMSYAQDFMINNRGLTTINTTQLNIYAAGYRDTTFKLTRLKSNWNSYFTNLQDVEISDEHWNREDLTALTHLSTFVLIATNQNHSNNATSNPAIPIPGSAIDSVINQIAAGAGQTISNGVIWIVTGGSARTSNSNTSVAALDAKGWIIYIDSVLQ
jgi:hypothetical protein